MTSRRALLAVLAVATVLLSGCGFAGLYSAPLPGGASLGSNPYRVTAYFADVLDLVPQSAVKVNDVAEGKVTAISLADCPSAISKAGTWCAKVTMSVNGEVQLPGNARAEILQTSLLGEKYVALLNPTGAGSGSLRAQSTIPYDRTSSAPDAEQVLGALSLLLNEGGLQQIRSIAIELNKALGGKDREQAVRDLLGQLNTFTGTLDAQKNEITTALSNIDILARTLNSQKQIIINALDTFPAALKVLESERVKLVSLLTSLSHLGAVASQVINATQTNLVSSLKDLEPVLTRLTATGSSLPKSLRILGTFPFPLGLTRQFVRGDYANLNADLNINLVDELCGLLNIGCKGSNSASQKALTGMTATNSATVTPLTPVLVGAGS